MPRWKRKDPEEPQDSGASLVASAARIRNLDGRGGWQTYKFGDVTWQTEVWRLYDVIGELRFVADWIGSACSRVRIYVAQVDDNGRVQKEVTNKKIAGLSDTLFGGPSHKAEALRMLGINLTIAGDAYIVGRSTDDVKSDEWFVLSGSEIRRYNRGGSNIVEMSSYDGEPERLNLDRDMVIRIWTPHPRRGLWAQSPTRAAMPMLWEIERLTRYVFSQIDSRLVSAGILAIPKETSFPDEDADIPGAEGLTAALMRAGSLSLKGEGTAAGVIPLIIEIPDQALGKLQLIMFGSELSQQALELRSEAIRRFALAMDIDPSILSGAGEANHWGAWQIMEGQIKVHIEPLMTRICDALTTAYLKPALEHMDQDPDRFVFWYDTAPLVVRPERGKEAREMYKEGIVGRETVINLNDLKLSDMPDDDEDLRMFTRELMLRDPQLMQIPAIRVIAGFTEEKLPANTVVTPQQGQGGAGPPPPPAPPTGIVSTPGMAPPADSTAANAPPPLAAAPAIAASAGVDPLFMVCNATVYRAMELAGKRLAGNVNRQTFSCQTHEIHTRISARGRDYDKLTAGAWDHLPALLQELDPDLEQLTSLAIQGSLEVYCAGLLDRSLSHKPALLHAFLAKKGMLGGTE